LLEAIEHADGKHIDVALAVKRVLHVVVALPFAADPQIARHVEARTDAESYIGGALVLGPRAKAAQRGFRSHLAVIEAEAAVDGELVRERPRANRRQIPGGRLIRNLGAATGGLGLAEVAVAELDGDVRMELVAAEEPPRGVLVVTVDAGSA